MTVRNDLTIDWDSSPRIIYVDSPSAEITMQDLHDTLRVEESKTINIDNLSIVNSAGKENLGGGVKVGLTVTLLNALLAFEARTGPSFELCRVSGGNLVAVDDVEATYDSPIHPTAYIQVVLSNSSSATLQEQVAIQYSSFNGGVTIDVTSPYSGTVYPKGTPQQPINNIMDAYDIAVERGIPTFYVIGDLDLLDMEPDLEGFSFIGQGKTKTVIYIDSLAQTKNCEFFDAHIRGYLDGNTRLRGCLIDNLNYIKGYVEQCVLSPGTIVLAGTDEAHFLDCWSGQPGLGTPTIDMQNSGQALALRNYNGGIKLTNKSGSEPVSIDLNSGQVKLTNTVIAGTIVLRGVGTLTEDFSNGANIVNQLVNVDSITESVWDDVHATNLNEIWEMLGLDLNSPITINAVRHLSNNLNVSIIDNGNGSYTLKRQ